MVVGEGHWIGALSGIGGIITHIARRCIYPAPRMDHWSFGRWQQQEI
jgi:hypothetical protein